MHTDEAHVLERQGDDLYVHYVNADKRLDEWVSERDVRPNTDTHEDGVVSNGNGTSRKRKRGSTEGQGEGNSRRTGSPGRLDTQPPLKVEDLGPAAITEEEYDIQHHKQITAKRNFDKVIFGRWQIKTWYVPFRWEPCIIAVLPQRRALPQSS